MHKQSKFQGQRLPKMTQHIHFFNVISSNATAVGHTKFLKTEILNCILEIIHKSHHKENKSVKGKKKKTKN